MPVIRENISLKPFNTFGIDATARYFTEASCVEDWRSLQESGWLAGKHLVIGGGSNVLFTSSYDGLIILQSMKGIEMVEQDEKNVWLRAKAGESWHGLVIHAVNSGWGGIENLSLIPGSAGAAPMQNIGAYGVELKDVFESLEAFDKTTGEIRTFDRQSCEFGYRYSVFKGSLKDRFVIQSLTLKLSKNPTLNTSYGAVEDTIKKMKLPLTIQSVSDAIISIRKSKLPDPAYIGNAGSFFKNPVIKNTKAEALLSAYPGIPHYSAGDMIKIPAGWLIEQCGWKGKRVGDTGCHAEQSLVIVNYGSATGEEIWKHAQNVQQSVVHRFDILLEPEVNIISS
jgi:UDP-N-acetylmuramate dehydrogenase